MHLRSICCGKNALLFAFLFVMHTASALPMNNQHWTEGGSSTLSGTTVTPTVVRVPGDGEVVVVRYEGETVMSTVSDPEYQGVSASIVSQMEQYLHISRHQIFFQSVHSLPMWGPDSSIRFKYYIAPINHDNPKVCPTLKNVGEPDGSGKVTTTPGQKVETTLKPNPLKEGEPVLTQTLPGKNGKPDIVRTLPGHFGDDEMPVWDQSTKTYRKIQVEDTQRRQRTDSRS
ncbi:hypothetical protein EV361DRAFT_1031300 [Lentinula raphanica]|nr:hypothetical protein EV361DRAFT_1031300 [Lentinula raphanica]